MMKTSPRAPQQARSRQTMERLLAATLEVIEANGLAGVTIPEIAATADLSTGSIYRRFADKEELVRMAFLQLLEGAQATNQVNLPPDRFEGMKLRDVLQALGRALVAQYRGRTGLLKALDQFLETQTDEAFRHRALDLIEASLRGVIEALLPLRAQIAAEDPERAITFALLNAITVIEVHKLHNPLLWQRLLPLDDDALAGEITRMMTAYLT